MEEKKMNKALPQAKMVSIGDIHKNPGNPRIIKDANFKKLVQSIKGFPQMLQLRPVVADDSGMILGGNMRYEACKSAGLKKVPVLYASDLTEDQKKEFIVKDNISGGTWDWEKLSSEYEVQSLIEWGFDEWELGLGPKPEGNAEDEEEHEPPKNMTKKYICPECGHEFEP
jgi:hypothetical protein